MASTGNVFDSLTPDECEQIKALGSEIDIDKGTMIFAEGDEADSIYFVESGTVSIFIRKFTSEEEVCRLGPSDCFGEMGLVSEQSRNASAKAETDVKMRRISKSAFLNLVKNDIKVAQKINFLMSKRNEELLLQENLIDSTGVSRSNLHVSIKGDPSLRESTFTRQRYASVVDPILTELKSVFEDLMLNRNVFQLFVGFNNGEVRTSSIFDPFSEELHPANKLVDKGYIERHFPVIAFDEKIDMVNRIYQTISADDSFNSLPDNFSNRYSANYKDWEPVSPGDIKSVIGRLQDLRDLPDFYLRNFAINLTKGSIRMQFNCDGTHIVSPDDFQRFLNENLE